MFTSRQDFIRLAVIVIVWYLGLSYLPQIIGTCMDGEYGFSVGEIIVSVAGGHHRCRNRYSDRIPHSLYL